MEITIPGHDISVDFPDNLPMAYIEKVISGLVDELDEEKSDTQLVEIKKLLKDAINKTQAQNQQVIMALKAQRQPEATDTSAITNALQLQTKELIKALKVVEVKGPPQIDRLEVVRDKNGYAKSLDIIYKEVGR